MRIPTLWSDVLSKIQTVFPSAVIAGGALRDLDNERPIKDVDIFIPVQTPDDYTKIYDLFPDAVLSKHTQYGIKAVPDDADRDIWAIFNLNRGSLLDGSFISFDLIICTEAAADMNSFDINLCQIIYDGHKVVKSNEYIKGQAEKVLKVLNVNRTDRNARRMERMKAKYPDFTVELYQTDLEEFLDNQRN